MEHRPLGSTPVSVFGLGCNNFGMRIDVARTRAVVDAALDVGVTFLDTADAYATSEDFLGEVLDGRRDRVVLATKFGNPIGGEPAGASPAYLRQACERSLARLGTDRIDLYQLHKPDRSVPLAETFAALDELVEAGKIVQYGICNVSPGLLDELLALPGLSAAFVSVQNRYNVLEQGAGPLVERCDEAGRSFLAYYPLANGLLTGRYAAGTAPTEGSRIADWHQYVGEILSDANFAIVDRLTAWAADHGRSLLELALAWQLAHDAIPTIISGASTPEQVRANQTDWRLTSEQLAEVDVIADAARADVA